MNAVEIGDARMDTGVLTEAQRQQPPFEPARELSADEVLAVFDRLFACEAGFIDGHALASTLYTCLYTQAPDRMQGSPLVSLVLRSYVLATLKTCDLLWSEVARGNVKEGEDVWCDKAGVSLLEDVQPDIIFAALDEAYDWLQTAELPEALRTPLLDRLVFRMELLYTLCLVFDENACLEDAERRLADTRKILAAIQPHPDFPTPSGVFDMQISRTLPTAQPPRVVPIMSFDDALKNMSQLLEDISEVFDLVLHGQSWWDWSRSFTHIARRTPPMHPFSRSLLEVREEETPLIDRACSVAMASSAAYNRSLCSVVSSSPTWARLRGTLSNSAVPSLVISVCCSRIAVDSNGSSSSRSPSGTSSNFQESSVCGPASRSRRFRPASIWICTRRTRTRRCGRWQDYGLRTSFRLQQSRGCSSNGVSQTCR